MKYAIGYFDHDESEKTFAEVLEAFSGHIAEVYFPWPGLATCRTAPHGPYAFERLTDALIKARRLGIRLDLLINANCYGGRATSQALERIVLESVEDVLRRIGGLETVTTTSLTVAHVIKKYYPTIKMRASINMQLRDEKSFAPLMDRFDEFYLPRENNHNLEAIERLKRILSPRPLFLLANSGCMPWCPGQIFHDNLVAHEGEISQTRNIDDFIPYICWDYYQKHPHMLLQGTWIRPEDVKRYEGYVSMMKLATRINERPYRVIKAYVEEQFRGNLLNLMEPDHSALLHGAIIDNSAFPDDWEANRQEKDEWYHQLYKRVVLRNTLSEQ